MFTHPYTQRERDGGRGRRGEKGEGKKSAFGLWVVNKNKFQLFIS